MPRAVMNNTVLYPGTFDPITAGHLDIITKTAAVFPNVVVGISTSRAGTMLNVDNRLRLVRESCAHLANVKCETYDGLTVKFAGEIKSKVIVRGVRSPRDLEYEQGMSYCNSQLAPDIITIFIPSDPQLAHISSTLVREISNLHGDITHLVPSCVRDFLTPPKEKPDRDRRR